MEELKKVNKEIKELNDKIEQVILKQEVYKNISDEDRKEIIVKFEAQLSDLKADKERWFKLVEEEKKRGNLNYSHSNSR